MTLDSVIRVLSLLFALGTPLALWYRFVLGGKSRISFRQLSDPRERDWGYGRHDNVESFSNYVHLLAVNHGWWKGLIWDTELQKVSFSNGNTVPNASKETIEVAIDAYADGESRRLDLGDPHQRTERSISGRDIAHLKFVPFIQTGGELAKNAERSDEAEFTFSSKIKDNKRTYSSEFTVSMDVSDVKFEE